MSIEIDGILLGFYEDPVATLREHKEVWLSTFATLGEPYVPKE